MFNFFAFQLDMISVIHIMFCLSYFSMYTEKNCYLFDLFQAAKKKGCEPLKEWIQPVRNHFWHCAQECGGNIDKLKIIKGILIMYIFYLNVFHNQQ